MQKEYEQQTKKPFYLYSGLILVAALVLLAININLNAQKEKRKFVENPKLGDVYLIGKESNNSKEYYFLRISQIVDDTILTYHSNLVYSGFVNRLNDADFFVMDEEYIFTKSELKKMLENDEIVIVNRNYDDSEGFDRIQ